MKLKRVLLSLMLTGALLVSAAGCSSDEDDNENPGAQQIQLQWNFSDGASGWQSGWVEYGSEQDIQPDSGIRSLPAELEIDGTGFYIQSMNSSDDVFMYLYRGLSSADGIVAGQEYQVSFIITFASNAPSGCMGIGGAPGEAVYLKAGATAQEPEAYQDSDGFWLLNVEKDGGNSGGGPAADMVGDIANGLVCEDVDLNIPPYVSLESEHQHSYTVTASDNGEIWLIVGTDSGFEGLTALYYQNIEVILEPVVA